VIFHRSDILTESIDVYRGTVLEIDDSMSQMSGRAQYDMDGRVAARMDGRVTEGLGLKALPGHTACTVVRQRTNTPALSARRSIDG
jgi:hypothetical protein